MKYYVYGEIFLKHGEWVREYLRGINSFIEKHGGRVLSRSIKMEKVEGERDLSTNVILLEFSNRQTAIDFFDDPHYQPLRKMRLEGSVSEFVMFPAEDLAISVAGAPDA